MMNSARLLFQGVKVESGHVCFPGRNPQARCISLSSSSSTFNSGARDRRSSTFFWYTPTYIDVYIQCACPSFSPLRFSPLKLNLRREHPAGLFTLHIEMCLFLLPPYSLNPDAHSISLCLRVWRSFIHPATTPSFHLKWTFQQQKHTEF